MTDWLTDYVTNSTGQRASWGSSTSQASLEFPHILWNPIFHYRVHKYPPLVCVTSQINSLYFLNIYFNILPSTPRSSKFLFSIKFPHQNLVCTSSLLLTCYIPCLSHSFWFDRSNNIWWTVQIMKLLIMQSSPLLWYLVPPRRKSVSQQAVFANPQPILLPPREVPNLTPVYNNTKDYISAFFSLRICGQRAVRRKILDRTAACIHLVQTARVSVWIPFWFIRIFPIHLEISLYWELRSSGLLSSE